MGWRSPAACLLILLTQHVLPCEQVAQLLTIKRERELAEGVRRRDAQANERCAPGQAALGRPSKGHAWGLARLRRGRGRQACGASQ